MNALLLQTNNFPLVPFLLIILASGIGFYFLMVRSWKVLDEQTAPPPELLKAGECLQIQAFER